MRNWMLFGLILGAAAAAAQETAAPVSMVRGRMLLPVSLDGIGPYPFLLDTGLKQPVVDRDVAQFTGLAELTETVDAGENAAPAPVMYTPALEAAGLPPWDGAVAVVDLSALTARLGTRVAGLLPAHRPGFEVTLDFARGEVRWRPLTQCELHAADRPDIARLTFAPNGVPRISGAVDTTHVWPFEIDTVWDGVIAVSPDLAAQLDAAVRTGTRSRLGGIDHVRPDTLELAGAVFESPLCQIDPQAAAPRIGLAALRQFRVTLNYEHALIRLERAGDRVFKPGALPPFGMLLDTWNGAWRVLVAEGSPAALAGVRNGDRLIAVGETLVQVQDAAYVESVLEHAAGAITVLTVEGDTGRQYIEVDPAARSAPADPAVPGRR